MFKVGDFVMVREDLIGGSYYEYNSADQDLYFAREMEKFRGNIYKVTRIVYNGPYEQYNLSLGEEEREWVFNNRMLIPINGLRNLIWKRKSLK